MGVETDCLYCAFYDSPDNEYPCNGCVNGVAYPENEGKPLLWTAKGEATNAVNHPSHYNQGGIECIDAMIAAYGKEATGVFCVLNAFKYLWRAEHKNGKEDIEKAIWYLKKRLELTDGE